MYGSLLDQEGLRKKDTRYVHVLDSNEQYMTKGHYVLDSNGKWVTGG